MISKYTKEIGQEEIKDIIVSSRASKFDTIGCVLESKFGKITLDLSQFEDIKYCQLFVRRLSGNGKISVLTQEIVTEVTVLSRISQGFLINTTAKTLEISRPEDSTGEVCIIGITIGFDHQNEEIPLIYNWKALIAKCGKYNCLRMIGNQLFASEGAYIENSSMIRVIETAPPGMAFRDVDCVRFSGPCEIIKLELDPAAVAGVDTRPYMHREKPIPIFTALNQPVVPRTHTTPLPPPPVAPPPASRGTVNIVTNNVVYDSNSVRSISKLADNKLVKFINSNGKDYILLRRSGSISIPIAALVPQKEYIVMLSIKKINGNGKVSVGFAAGNDRPIYTTTLAENAFYDKCVTIATPHGNGDSFRLVLSMLDDSSGEVLITRITVVEDLLVKPDFDSLKPVSLEGLNYNDKRFVIVIPSYNNSKWCEKNIYSVLNQNYKNYRVIFTDDCSSDDTFEKVSNIVENSFKKNQFTLIKNTTRLGALANLYNMIHNCEDDEIILTLDGDDWLANENVLRRLSHYYSTENIWMTYGQYQNYPKPEIGIAQQIPPHVIKENSFRQFTWCSTHLRTFYAWLFKIVKKEDLLYRGNFMSMTWDMAMMFPMLEMAGYHSKFINEVLYIYNMDNPINDHKVNIKLQQDLDRYVRRLPAYNRLDYPIVKKPTIGLMIIATGKYHEYIQGLISSADNYFLKNLDVTYYVFSEVEHNIRSNRNVVQLHIDHRPFPFASMDRFKHFTRYAEYLSREKYLYYVDVDCLFVDHVSTEILGDLVGVCHCGYFNKQGPVETNPNSVLYVDEREGNKYRYYFGGGFSGGRADNYLDLSKWCSDMIDSDVDRGIIPIWHDETALNRYFLDHSPTVVLSPSYHYPQTNLDHYKKIWNRNFEPKILLLDKNHGAMRT